MITPQQRDEIESKLHRYYDIDGTYEIDDQGLVSVEGHVQRTMDTIVRMPVSFDVVTGSFIMHRCALRTLQGFPRRVGHSVSISRTKVSSLVGAPDHVGGSFFCHNNQLASLAGAPDHVGGSFWCHNNQLESLVGAPDHVDGGFRCDTNHLKSLEGAPQHVGGSFWCFGNPIVSVEGVSEHVGGEFYCTWNKKLPLLRLLVYKNIRLSNSPASVMEIINKYAGTTNPGDVLKCASELNEHGFEGNAEW